MGLPMNNAEYWRGRFAILEDAAHKQSDMYLQSLEKLYREVAISVQKEIEAWYGRFANNNQISVSDAKKLMEDIPNKVRDMLGILVEVNLKEREPFSRLDTKIRKCVYTLSY